MSAQKYSRFNLRILNAQKERLEEMAKDEGVSVNALILQAIGEFLDDESSSAQVDLGEMLSFSELEHIEEKGRASNSTFAHVVYNYVRNGIREDTYPEPPRELRKLIDRKTLNELVDVLAQRAEENQQHVTDFFEGEIAGEMEASEYQEALNDLTPPEYRSKTRQVVDVDTDNDVSDDELAQLLLLHDDHFDKVIERAKERLQKIVKIKKEQLPLYRNEIVHADTEK